MKLKELTLSHTEAKELRRLYGHYKNIRIQQHGGYDTREEVLQGRRDAVADYERRFPELNKAGVSIGDLPEIIYSQNQLQFIEDAGQTHFEIDYDYSGRGMYGDSCPSIVCDSHNDLQTTAQTKMDSMGRQIVIYAEY